MTTPQLYTLSLTHSFLKGKNIDIDCHVIRDKVLTGAIHLMHVTSKEKVADILIQYLYPGPFYNLHSKLRMIDVHSSLRGDIECKEREMVS